MADARPERISVLALAENIGKAETVRRGLIAAIGRSSGMPRRAPRWNRWSANTTGSRLCQRAYLGSMMGASASSFAVALVLGMPAGLAMLGAQILSERPDAR